MSYRYDSELGRYVEGYWAGLSNLRRNEEWKTQKDAPAESDGTAFINLPVAGHAFRDAERYRAAVEAGDYQFLSQGMTEVTPGKPRRVLLMTATEYLWSDEVSDDNGGTGWFGFSLKTDAGSYVYFHLAGPGRDDLYDRYRNAVEYARQIAAEAERDPEGAFGGRGNNLAI